MGEQSMRECLIEQLVILNRSLPPQLLSGSRAMHWYDDGADVSQLQCVGANVNGLRAWGYLEGVADVFDVTVGELLESHHLDWSGSKTFSRAKLPNCPKCGGKGRRCNTPPGVICAGLPGCHHCFDFDCGGIWTVPS